MGMMTNKTGQVTKPNTAKLKNVFMVVPNAIVNLKATSTSMILKSDDTYKHKHILLAPRIFQEHYDRVLNLKLLLD